LNGGKRPTRNTQTLRNKDQFITTRNFLVLFVLVSAVVAPAQTSPKKIVSTGADLPHVSYPVDGDVQHLLNMPMKDFLQFALPSALTLKRLCATLTFNTMPHIASCCWRSCSQVMVRIRLHSAICPAGICRQS